MAVSVGMSQGESSTRLALILAALSGIACSSPRPAPNGPTGRAFVKADRLFRRDPRWLGADAALSVPLSKGRSLWLFGDTFVAISSANVRSESKMVRNTVAIQAGTTPAPPR